MSCPANHLNEQKAQTQNVSSFIPNNVAVTKLYLSHFSTKNDEGILITSLKNGYTSENRILLKLDNPDNFGILQLSYRGPKFYNYFSSNAIIKVKEILLKKSSTKKKRSSLLRDLHNGSWNIFHIITRKKSDCNYLFEKAIKDNYTVILAILLEIVDANSSSRKLALYPHSVNGIILHRAVAEKNMEVIQTLLKWKLGINSKSNAGWTPLLVAVNLEMSDVVDLLISNGADVNAQNKKLQSPLHYAGKRNNSKILDSLIKSRAKLDKKDKLNQTPLHYAVNAGSVVGVDILLKKGANYKLEDKFNRTAFHLAAERLNLDIIEVFLKNKVDADILGSSKQTPLFYVSQKTFHSQPKAVHKETYSNIVDIFLQNGANINFQDSEGRTPLYVGVMNNNIEFVQTLLEHGADITIHNKCGRNVVHSACQNLKNKCIQVLLNCNIDINAIDVEGETALHVAVEKMNCRAVELILQKNPNINIKEKNGKTALHLAIESGCLSIIELLLKNKADVNLKDSSGRTALHLALENPSITIKIIKSILNSTNNINAVDADKRTVLHVATEKENCRAVKIILKRNPNINMTDKSKETALHLALTSKCLPIVELLLKNKADVNYFEGFLGRNALHLALEDTMNYNIPIKIIKSVLNSTSEINARDNSAWTAVHFAAFNQNVKALKYLIDKHADVNAKNCKGRTPLHLVMNLENGHISYLKCIRILINHKADINAVDNNSITPLHLACFAKNAEVVKFLIKNGADSSMKDKDRRTVYHYACMPGLNKQLWVNKDVEEYIEDILNVLVEENISINCVDIFGKTPLHYATENKLLYVSLLLLNIGANINILDKDYKSAFDNLTKLCVHKYNSINEIVISYVKHIVRMKVMKLWVQEKILDKIYKVDNERHLECIQSYERVCIEEIDLMKTTNLDQSITYYDFLKKSQHDAVNYIQNKNIVKPMQSNELTCMFPLYGSFLKSHLREIQRRSYFYGKIQKSLKSYIFYKLPIYCLHEIFRYLDNSELGVLLEATKSVV